MAHPFSELQPEYVSLLARMSVTRQREVDQAVAKLMGFVKQGRYAEAVSSFRRAFTLAERLFDVEDVRQRKLAPAR